MMLRIREVESTQTIGDLRQKIAELEVLVINKINFSIFPFNFFCNIESRINNPWSNNG
jgi:hypothetical protein